MIATTTGVGRQPFWQLYFNLRDLRNLRIYSLKVVIRDVDKDNISIFNSYLE
ncbi:hypothetical protein KKE26_06160 [bacterium]|nr:hypothetical protein [bacterium]